MLHNAALRDDHPDTVHLRLRPSVDPELRDWNPFGFGDGWRADCEQVHGAVNQQDWYKMVCPAWLHVYGRCKFCVLDGDIPDE